MARGARPAGVARLPAALAGLRVTERRMRLRWHRWQRRRTAVGVAALLLVRAARTADRVRIVGLAAESAFFSLLSLPALLLGIVGTLGHLGPVLGTGTVTQVRDRVLDLAATALTAQTVETLVAPLVDDFLDGAQGGILSVTFLLSLWSGSRAMNVFIESITIAYGLEGIRGYIRQRALALFAYAGGLVFTLVVLPVLVAGPRLIRETLPATAEYLRFAYWPAVTLVSVVFLVALYVVSVPVRTPLWRHVPGAVVAMGIWVLGSGGLRLYLEASFGQVGIYGSLSAPIAVLAWLYVTALAVLIGSVLNAEIDAKWPTTATAQARARIAAERGARAARLAQRHERELREAAASQEGTETESEA